MEKKREKCEACELPGDLRVMGVLWLIQCFALGAMGVLPAFAALLGTGLLGGSRREVWAGALYVIVSAFLAGNIAGLLWGDFRYLFWDAEGKLHLHGDAPQHTEAQGRFLKLPVMSLRRGGVYEWHSWHGHLGLLRAPAWRVSGRLGKVRLAYAYAPLGNSEKRVALSLGEPNEALLWLVNIPVSLTSATRLKRFGDRTNFGAGLNIWGGL